MNPQSAAAAANLIHSGIVIPIHYKLGENCEKELMDLVGKEIEVRLLYEE